MEDSLISGDLEHKVTNALRMKSWRPVRANLFGSGHLCTLSLYWPGGCKAITLHPGMKVNLYDSKTHLFAFSLDLGDRTQPVILSAATAQEQQKWLAVLSDYLEIVKTRQFYKDAAKIREGEISAMRSLFQPPVPRTDSSLFIDHSVEFEIVRPLTALGVARGYNLRGLTVGLLGARDTARITQSNANAKAAKITLPRNLTALALPVQCSRLVEGAAARAVACWMSTQGFLMPGQWTVQMHLESPGFPPTGMGMNPAAASPQVGREGIAGISQPKAVSGRRGAHGIYSGADGRDGECGANGMDGTLGTAGSNATAIQLLLKRVGLVGRESMPWEWNDGDWLLEISGGLQMNAMAKELLPGSSTMFVDVRGGNGGHGGRGGDGGDGGSGGNGARGMTGSSGSSSSSGSGGDGGDGGPGGDGGDGGCGGCGGRGGNGGNAGAGGDVHICVEEQDAPLLMLVEVDCRAGEPGLGGDGGAGGIGGAPGHGGPGGYGGSGGSGGEGYSDGSSGYTGRRGRRGRPGSDGVAGQRGFDGAGAANGLLAFSVGNESSSRRYTVTVLGFELVSERHEAEIVFEPNSAVIVRNITVCNTGGLTLPAGAILTFPTSETADEDAFGDSASFFALPQLGVNEIFTTDPSLFFRMRLFDVPPSMEFDRRLDSRASIHSQVTLLNRPFVEGVTTSEVNVRYPVALGHVVLEDCLAVGEIGTVKVELNSFSALPLPYVEDGETVSLEVHCICVDSHVRFVGTVAPTQEGGDEEDSQQRKIVVIQRENIGAGGIFNIEFQVELSSECNMFDQHYVAVELHWRGKRIEMTRKLVRNTPVYRPHRQAGVQADADVLLVTSSLITPSIFAAWARIFLSFGMTMDVWDCGRYDGVSFQDLIGTRHELTWVSHYRGSLIVLADGQSAWPLLNMGDVCDHFYGESWKNAVPPSEVKPGSGLLVVGMKEEDVRAQLSLAYFPVRFSGSGDFGAKYYVRNPSPLHAANKARELMKAISETDPKHVYILGGIHFVPEKLSKTLYSYGVCELQRVVTRRNALIAALPHAEQRNLAFGDPMQGLPAMIPVASAVFEAIAGLLGVMTIDKRVRYLSAPFRGISFELPSGGKLAWCDVVCATIYDRIVAHYDSSATEIPELEEFVASVECYSSGMFDHSRDEGNADMTTANNATSSVTTTGKISPSKDGDTPPGDSCAVSLLTAREIVCILSVVYRFKAQCLGLMDSGRAAFFALRSRLEHVCLPRDKAQRKVLLSKARDISSQRQYYGISDLMRVSFPMRQETRIPFLDTAMQALDHIRPVGEQEGKWSANTPACELCEKSFSITLGRHHCRSCGRCVCHPCSNQELQLKLRGQVSPVRVCDKCHLMLTGAPSLSQQENCCSVCKKSFGMFKKRYQCGSCYLAVCWSCQRGEPLVCVPCDEARTTRREQNSAAAAPSAPSTPGAVSTGTYAKTPASDNKKKDYKETHLLFPNLNINDFEVLMPS